MANPHNKTASKKPKLVRDSFTIPKAEFAVIEDLKTRAIVLGSAVKKSELLRAGLKLLQGLNDSDFKAALAAVPTLKTGRPSSEVPEEKAEAKTEVAQPAPSAQPAAKKVAKAKAAPAAKKPAAKRAPAAKASPAAVVPEAAAPAAPAVEADKA